MKQKMLTKLKQYKCLLIPFTVLVAIYLLGISAIIRGNINYIDDAGRVFYGYKTWDNFSRYLSNFFSNIIHADTYLTDVSPLPQILAVVIMSLSSIIVIHTLSRNERVTAWEIIAVLPLGLSPYFLECLSYKYDAPYMAFSVLFSILPLVFRQFRPYVYWIAAFIGTLCMCMTYQASSGIFPMLVVLICFQEWNSGKKIKEILPFALGSGGSYLLGIIFFRLFLMKTYDSYVSTEMASLRQMLTNTVYNFRIYFQTILSDMKVEWLILIGIIAIGFVYIMTRDSVRKIYISLPLNILLLVGMITLMFGVYPILELPTFDPRGMYGFGVLVGLMSVVVAQARKAYWSKIAAIVLCWMFFVFSFTYGNALVAQQNYTDFRIEMVINDLNELDMINEDGIKNVQLTGTIGHAPIIQNMPDDYDILKRLVPVTFRGDWYWGQYQFYRHYGMDKVFWDPNLKLKAKKLPIIEDTMYHTIRGDGENILIQLK